MPRLPKEPVIDHFQRQKDKGTRKSRKPEGKDSDSEVRMMAASGLGDLLQVKSSPPDLVRRLQDPDELVRIEAAESLGAIGDKNMLTVLWEALEDSSSLV